MCGGHPVSARSQSADRPVPGENWERPISALTASARARPTLRWPASARFLLVTSLWSSVIGKVRPTLKPAVTALACARAGVAGDRDQTCREYECSHERLLRPGAGTLLWRRFVGQRVRCWHRLRREGRGFFEDEAVVVLRPVADVACHLEAGGGHLGDDRPLLDAMAR